MMCQPVAQPQSRTATKDTGKMAIKCKNFCFSIRPIPRRPRCTIIFPDANNLSDFNITTMPLFTESDLKREFSAAYLARGRDYQARGQVLGLTVDPNDGLIKARIRGSGKQPYRASIAIHSARAGRARIEGDCTCPVGFNCKHVVAALLETLALDKVRTAPAKTAKLHKPAPPMEDPALRTWLDRLALRTATQPETVPAPDVGEHLIYLLRLDRRLHLAYAWVDIQLVRLLKAGGYGKAQAFSGGLQSTARCVTDTDRAVFRWLEVLRQEVLVGGGYGSYPLGGAEGGACWRCCSPPDAVTG